MRAAMEAFLQQLLEEGDQKSLVVQEEKPPYMACCPGKAPHQACRCWSVTNRPMSPANDSNKQNVYFNE